MTRLRFYFVFSIALVVAACSSSGSKTLGQLKYEAEQEEEIEFEKLSHEEVRKEYKELIDLFEDDKLKEQIERRIADVYMMEATDVPEKEEESQYVEAIKSYRNILERYPNSPDNAEVFYQLAKAYDLEGDQREAMRMLTELVNRHPTYKNIVEAHFRKADIHFNWQEYDQAQSSYQVVTQYGQGRLKLNAYYMLGWVYYKKFNFEASIDSFAYVMNQLVIDDSQFDNLGKAEKPLVEDAIHSISLALDKVGGAEMISDLPSIANAAYLWRIYDYLGGYYLDKELYEQSAKTFRHWVRNFPRTEQAPYLHNRLIDTYEKAKFPREALKEKENYVAAYGITSDYPGNKDGISQDIKDKLIVFLEELARYAYTEGQTRQEVVKEELAKPSGANQDKIRKSEGEAVAAFQRAARFYGEYITTFPQDTQVDQMRFLKAESHYQAGSFLDAATEYERVAYEPSGKSAADKAADSGYSAILSYQNYIGGLERDKSRKSKKLVAEYRAIAVESMLRFSKTFDKDSRSPTVLTNAAEYLFGLDQYERAIAVAQDLVSDPKLDSTLMKTAYGIMAHSNFKLERYPAAEAAYIAQRGLVQKGSEEYTQISERIAATVFKNAERVEAESGQLASAEELLKIKRLSPDSPIRITAQHDAASLLMAVEAWPRAITELKELIALFPGHELAPQFPRKLALAYEKNEEWSNAANAYLDLYKNDADAEIKREALFQAAMMFETAKNYEAALTYFKRYAYDYEEPFSTRMEARYHMATNYEMIGDIGKQLYWLRRIVDGDKKAGPARTPRSQYLGAWANAKYGDYYASEFAKRKLYQPLQKSLPKKKEFFENALSRFQQAAEYGILEFVSMSSFKIGGLYEDFAKALRDAPSPSGLSASDRQLYAEIIEEQASPFDQLAVEVYQSNVDRAWEGHYNNWIEDSFAALRRLNPERYNKQEVSASYGEEIL